MTLKVDFGQLQRGSQQLDECKDTVNGISQRLDSALSAHGVCYGTDKPGNTHASGYEPQLRQNMQATQNRVDTIGRYADAVSQFVKGYSTQEDSNASSL